jgi:hypothetical protein
MMTNVEQLLQDPTERPARRTSDALHGRIMASLDDAPPAPARRRGRHVLIACLLVVGLAGVIAFVALRPRQAQPDPNPLRAQDAPTLPERPFTRFPEEIQIQFVRFDLQLTDPYRREAQLLAADARRTVAQLTARMPMF